MLQQPKWVVEREADGERIGAVAADDETDAAWAALIELGVTLVPAGEYNEMYFENKKRS